MAERVSVLHGHYTRGRIGVCRTDPVGENAPRQAGVVMREMRDLILHQISAWPETLAQVGQQAAEAAGVKSAPGAGRAEWGYGASGQGEPGHGASGRGQSDHHESSHGEPSHGTSNHSESGHGESNHGESGHGESGHHESNHGESNHPPAPKPTTALLRIEPLKWWILGAPAPPIDPQHGATLDLSHARTHLRISGPQATDLLNRPLPLDLRPAAFPVGAVASGALHHVGVTLWHSPHGYELFIPRGFALSTWEVLLQTATQFGGEVV